MATGYTHPVKDGEITEFPAFALLCARAFGATILMRDESLDTPIPDEFKPSDFYANCAAKAEVELGRVLVMTEAECEAAALAEHEASKAYAVNYAATKATERARYENMIYEPAIKPALGGAEWRAKRLASLGEELARDRQQQREEEERTASRNKWVRELRESVR